MGYIGVMLNRDVLHRMVHGQPTFEHADLYARAAHQWDLSVLFFAADGVDVTARSARGYISTAKGSLEPASVPLPPVVHNRAFYPRGKEPRLIIRYLTAEGVYMFNPVMSFNKYEIYKRLSTNASLERHLPKAALLRPANFPWFRRQLLRRGELFVKPCHGSLGLGIVRIIRQSRGSWRYETAKGSRVTTLRGAWNMLRSSRTGRSLFMQEAIRLAKDQGRRFDLRVPVQMDRDGRWAIPGIVARRAGRHPFLTNLARGGQALEGRSALQRAFETGAIDVEAVMGHVEQVSIAIAETLRAHEPRLVDLGLDIGLNDQAHPYLIEVNRRDLRITLQQSGQLQAHAMAFANPIGYAAHVLERQ